MSDTSLAVPMPLESLAPFVEEFLQGLDRSQQTRRTYGSALLEFTRWLESQELARPQELILRYKEARLALGKSASTVSVDVAAIRAFCSYLVKTGRLSSNPADGIRAPKQSKHHKRDALTMTQAIRLLDSVDRSTLRGLRDFAILSLMVRAGLRDIELVRADVGDVRAMESQQVLWVHGKGRDEADEFVVLNASAEEALESYLAARGPLRGNDPLVASVDGRGRGRLTTRQVSKLVSQHLEGVGLKKATMTAHSLRHTAASLAIQAGVPLSQVQAMLRHADPRTTARYVHLHNRLQNAAEFALDF